VAARQALTIMTPLQFEQLYEATWNELDVALRQLRDGKRRGEQPVAGERFAELYRRCCEQLALARARTYPTHLIDRLDHLTTEAHQVIYQRKEFGRQRLAELAIREFPLAVRAHGTYVWIATAVFVVPLVALGLLVYFRPELILSMVDAGHAADFERMYAKDADHIGRTLAADTDWAMFGFYIRNNIGVAFQCFAGGLFAGIGSLFFLAFNGGLAGAVAGYLTERGLASTFYSFVVTHSAFELTAIVLSGAAGLRLGHAMIAPGRFTRRQALVNASRESIVVIYGVVAMLLIAAALEAFWSSAQWIPAAVKYSVAALCWIGVLSYLALQGRRAS
jgi:uncharacterized membrane protein SpoIIM required for sporulation